MVAWWPTDEGRKGWLDGMIFPEEYKFVGIKDQERRGEPVYFATEFLISREGPRLYRVKSRGSGFMREVDQLELIATGAEIEFYPERVDTRNRARLIDLAYGISRSGKANTVVFQGPDEHITFVKDPDPSPDSDHRGSGCLAARPALADSCSEEFGGMRNPRRPDGTIQATHPGSPQIRERKCLLPLPGLGSGAFSGLGPRFCTILPGSWAARSRGRSSWPIIPGTITNL